MSLVSERSVVRFTADCDNFLYRTYDDINDKHQRKEEEEEKICLLIWLYGACDNGDAQLELVKSESSECLKFGSSQKGLESKRA